MLAARGFPITIVTLSFYACSRSQCCPEQSEITQYLFNHALQLLNYWLSEVQSNANHMLGLYEEGAYQAEGAVETFERLGVTMGFARCLTVLARLLQEDGQLDGAGEAMVN
jgi:hypothetical protein